ncbi:MAG: Asp23/Gls24 family envelope stress response protein [Ndongobacter sp.]|nr:Asp23/Gls24 family envelope stress response protein [Ndongobacter sp.]
MAQFKGGSVHVANDVIDLIIASTAAKVEGVFEVKGYDEKARRLRRGYKKHIRTAVQDGTLSTALVLRVAKGTPILGTVEAVQEHVAKQVRSMLGLSCERVDIQVM